MVCARVKAAEMPWMAVAVVVSRVSIEMSQVDHALADRSSANHVDADSALRGYVSRSSTLLTRKTSGERRGDREMWTSGTLCWRQGNSPRYIRFQSYVQKSRENMFSPDIVSACSRMRGE